MKVTDLIMKIMTPCSTQVSLATDIYIYFMFPVHIVKEVEIVSVTLDDTSTRNLGAANFFPQLNVTKGK